MTEQGTKMIRVKDEVVVALRMFAGEIQAKSGDAVTDSDAVQELIRAVRPDLLTKGREQSGKSTRQKKKLA